MSENLLNSPSVLSSSSPVPSESPKVLVLTVEQLNRQIRQLIEGELNLVWVQGEISNFKAHTSGHYYFSLKDAKSQVSAVMFRGHNSRLKFKPVDGLEVIVRGRVTVYEPRGGYQIACEMMEPVGAGALQKAFEQLKEKLKKEGLFEPTKKRPLPPFPKHIAIVTSPTGAAIRDMLNILARRNKSVRVTLIPTIVQGDGAAAQICEALKKAWRLPDVDVVIVGRGGGSIEDLWAFNDENLARLISQSPVPVISAVGHEIDFTIADFVADLRAPTPSAAAELVAKNTADLIHKLETLEKMLTLAMTKIVRTKMDQAHFYARRLVDPKRRLQDLIQKNDELFSRLGRLALQNLRNRRMNIQILTGKLVTPEQTISTMRSKVEYQFLQLKNLVDRKLDSSQSRFSQIVAMLETLSPLKVVERGYSVTRKKDKLVRSTQELSVGDVVDVQLMSGSFSATVKEIEK